MKRSVKSLLFMMLCFASSACFANLSTKYLVFETLSEGRIKICVADGANYDSRFCSTEEAWINKHLIPGARWILVEKDEMPPQVIHRYLRIEANSLSVDLESVKRARRNSIRHIRNFMLQRSDVTLLRAMEAENTEEVVRLKNWRQALRDLPETFDMSPYTSWDLVLYHAIPEEFGVNYDNLWNLTSVEDTIDWEVGLL